jgi:hypothetical protein
MAFTHFRKRATEEAGPGGLVGSHVCAAFLAERDNPIQNKQWNARL